MRDDLLEARASVDWAASNFPSLAKRLEEWLTANVNVEIKELEGSARDNLIVAIEKEILPIGFSAEVGAYINSIRSSLDILARALARRHNITKIKEVYFPVVDSRDRFVSGNYKGSELIKGLPAAERGIIETLEPYQRGHKFLWPIHHLDIVRKHHKLLDVDIGPRTFSISMWGNIDDYITPVGVGWARTGDKETILALIRKDAPKLHIKFTPHVSISEAGIGRIPVVEGLNEFARAAHSIIELFDNP